MMTLLTRQQRRAISRVQARADVAYNGPEPRHEPARAVETCPTHHRTVPCSRC